MSDTGSQHEPSSAAPASSGRPGSSATRALPPSASSGSTPFVRTDDPTVISNRSPLPVPQLSGANPAELGRTLVGQKLDHFELQEFVGGGGMGAVFRALDTRLNRVVALKVLARDQADAEDKVRRFQVEAQSAARLDHEHIARVYYVGQDCGLHYIVFEYIEGVNLRDLVERQGPLPLGEAFSYTLQIADALAHASSRDVVHRDIKPSNVLVTPQGRAKLVDMGLARLHQVEHTGNDLTSSGVTLGTFDYISPEQARDPRSADVRSDIYSLGCTLFFMLTGQPPFPDGNVLQKLLQHNSDPPPDPAEFNPDLPESVSRIVRKMLAKDPRRRYQTPNDLIGELISVASALGISMHAPESVAHLARRPGWWDSVARHIPWAVPLATLIVAVVAMDFFSSPPTADQEEGPGPRRSIAGANAVQKPANGSRPAQDPTASTRPPSAGIDTAANAQGTNTQGAGSAVSPANATTPEQPAAAVPSESLTPPASTNTIEPVPTPPAVVETSAPNPIRARLEERDAVGLGPEASSAGLTVENASGSVADARPQPAESGLRPNASAAGSALQPPMAAESPREPGVLVVNPAASSSSPYEFTSLRAACAKVKNNEIIELRYNGRREEKPIKLNNLRITIRGGQDYHPVVLFRPRELETSPSMFTINGGQLNLYNVAVEFDVPSLAEVPQESWALFQTQRPEMLRLERCSLTIRNATEQRYALHHDVAFIDVKAPPGSTAMTMAMDNNAPPDQAVAIQLQDTLARGEATFLRAADLQPLSLVWDNGLLITTERFLSAVGDEIPSRNGGTVSIDLRHVTAAVRSGMFTFRNNESARHLLAADIKCTDCLLLAGGDAPLVDQFGAHTAEEFRDQFHWQGSRYFFVGFGTFWRIASIGSLDNPQTFTFDQWQEYWGEPREMAATWSQVYLKSPADSQRPVHTHTAADYVLDDRIRENMARGGASDSLDAGCKHDQLPPLPGGAPLEPPM